ncbi:MAG: efflux transporter outer membrane subunit [Sphingobium sp.]|nr:efflux transporter outer membrane subunit [Sphingobium sp.]
MKPRPLHTLIRNDAFPSAVLGSLLLSGCNMAPDHVRPVAPVPQTWPQGGAYAPTNSTESAAGLRWSELVKDQRLATLIDRALSSNRDLRATMASVLAARARYRVDRAARLPTLNAGASMPNQQQGWNGSMEDSYSADLGISAFEIDLFGRVRNEAQSALENWLATQEGARAAHISLVAETASAWATLSADQQLLTLAQQTQANAERSLALTRSLQQAGLSSGLDVQQAQTVVQQTRADAANARTQVAQDRNALELLVGGPVGDDLLPPPLAQLAPAISQVPAGLSSDILLARPDVLQAEHLLKAANADIGAARAALFPTISLTAAIGTASGALSALFTGDSFNASVTPSARYSIFGGGRSANLDASKAEKDRAVAQYEYAIQSAFKEVSDALARAGTMAEQQQAQQDLVRASRRYHQLAEQRYRVGISTYQATLDAQRTLYSAEQRAVATELAAVLNRITLYRVIGADF